MVTSSAKETATRAGDNKGYPGPGTSRNVRSQAIQVPAKGVMGPESPVRHLGRNIESLTGQRERLHLMG